LANGPHRLPPRNSQNCCRTASLAIARTPKRAGCYSILELESQPPLSRHRKAEGGGARQDLEECNCPYTRVGDAEPELAMVGRASHPRCKTVGGTPPKQLIKNATTRNSTVYIAAVSRGTLESFPITPGAPATSSVPMAPSNARAAALLDGGAEAPNERLSRPRAWRVPHVSGRDVSTLTIT
jgi:hypothetical protein